MKQSKNKYNMKVKKTYSIKKLLDEDFNEIGKKVFLLIIKNDQPESPNS